MSVKKKLFLSLLVVTLLFGAVACGDDDNDSLLRLTSNTSVSSLEDKWGEVSK